MVKCKKWMITFLVIVMITSFLPTKVIGDPLNAGDKSPIVETKDKRKKEPKILREVLEKREACTKTFFQDDMTFEVVVYGKPVHFLKDGSWQDIDNSLVDAASNEDINSNINQDSESQFGSGTEEEGTKDVLENKANDFKVKIAKDAKSSKLVSVKKGEYEISWDLPDANNVKARQVPVDTMSIEASIERNVEDEISKDEALEGYSPEEKAEIKKIRIENEKKKTLTNGSKVEFIEIFQEVDLQYETIGSMVKENIIINEKISNPIFKFNLNVKNLVPKLDKDNVITFYDIKDSSKAVYTINTPFMYDAKLKDSSNIKVTLSETKNGYELTLIPDKEWLDSADRSYPITLDPPIETSQNINSIHDTFVCSNDSDNKWLNQYLRTGYMAGEGTMRTYMKFDLPQLSTGDMIIGAQLNLAYTLANSSGSGQINVHRVKEDFLPQYLTWGNQVATDSKIADFATIGSQADGSWINWNITSIAKDWYNTGKNYGVMLEEDCGGSNAAFYSSDWGEQYSYVRPVVSLRYINNSGLESYWGYHSASAGRAGAGFINDYNGNLVYIHDDLSMNGNKMPVSIKHVYNSNDRKIDRIDTDITGGITGYYGPGWRLNLNQRVIATNITATPFKFIDEDGTSHYFSYDATTGKYKDESGMDLTLETNYYNGYDYGYCVKDKADNKLLFLPSGFLYRIRDKNNNEMILNYNGAVLSKIIDGAGRETNLESNSDGVLAAIIDPSGRRTSFAYKGAVLWKITYPDGKYTLYDYDSNNNLLSATNFDGIQLNYRYYGASPYRVSSVSQSNVDGTQGGTLAIAYGNNETTFTDIKGKKNMYQFNNCGNTISIKDADDSAMYSKFGTSKNNQLSLGSKLQSTITNYLQNHGAEYGGNYWATYYVGTGGPWGTCAPTTEEKYLGNQSFKVAKTSGVSGVNNCQLVKQPLTNLQKGGTYTLSGYIKTNGMTNVNKGGAILSVNYSDKTGTVIPVNSETVTGTNDWQRYQVTFTIPADSASNTVSAEFGIANETGTAYFDCLQLEKGSIANRYNLVENPGFAYGGAQPNFWSKCADCDSYDSAMGAYGRNTFRINGYGNKYKFIGQKIDVPGAAGDSFVVSGWAMADSAPISSGRYFALYVIIVNTDNTTQDQVIPFNEGVPDWQYTSDVVIAKNAYKSITIYALYDSNVNTAYFSDLQLYKEEFGQSYQYDAKGNVIATADLSKQQSSFEYSTNNDLVKATDAKGNQFKYEYDNNDASVKKHNLTKATSAENVVYSFEYDSSGNPKKSTIGDPAGLFISSSAEYTANGNYLKSMTDSSGNSVVNNWDERKGTLKSVVDGKGKSTFYTYDSMDRLQTVNKNVENNSLEIFSLDNNTVGSNGTTTVGETAKYESDTNGTYFASYDGTYISNPSKLIYDLGINSSAGTMALKFKYSTSGDKQIFENASAIGKLNLYTNSQDNLILGLANNSGTWIELIKISDVPVLKNQWNFVVLRWEYTAAGLKCTLFLNDKSYTNSTYDFKEFTGGKTGVGNSTTGIYQINGLIDNFAYSPRALSDTEIISLKQGTLQPVTGGNIYNYQNDRLQKIIHNGFNYNFGYDSLGNNTTVSVGNQNLITNQYETTTGKLLNSTYGNSQVVNNIYDAYDKVVGKAFNGVTRYKYQYDGSGNLGYSEEVDNGVNYRYIYDNANRLTKISDNKNNILRYWYDLSNNIEKISDNLSSSEPVNLALNKPAVSSSNQTTLSTPDKACDGNSSTRWSSSYNDNQWIYVDLGSVKNIKRVVLNWEAAYGKSYEIQVSNDASTWNTIYSKTDGEGVVDNITGLSASGRYVRMNGKLRGTSYGFSLYDFEVYDSSPIITRYLYDKDNKNKEVSINSGGKVKFNYWTASRFVH